MNTKETSNLILTSAASRRQHIAGIIGNSTLLLITAMSTFAVFFIFYFITKDALPFFSIEGFKTFFTGKHWYPSGHPAEFGALPIFTGTALVTLGAITVSVPLGISAAVCLSDLLPFKTRQIIKPIIEILAAIPSVAYGFFALVVFAPLLQNHGGALITTGTVLILAPILILGSMVCGDLLLDRFRDHIASPKKIGAMIFTTLFALSAALLWSICAKFIRIEVTSGTNALNVAIILGIMALPTIVSVSEDALQAAGRDIREGAYALGATRAETIIKAVIPASISGILTAIILGVMRAVGETMVVWMASGNAARIPDPWYNVLSPIRTLTATIAGDMGEADHVTGSSRFHVLFAMALCLLLFSFAMNLVSEIIVKRSRKKLGK